MESNNTKDWWTYHPLSISWRIHHKILLPGASHRSVGRRENRPVTQLTTDAEVIYLIQERRGPTVRNLHSSLVRWRLCCWGHLVLLLGYSGAAPAGWSWSYCSRSGSRSVQSSPRSWREYQWSRMGTGGSIDYPNINMSAIDLTKSYIIRHKSQNMVAMMYDSSDMNGDLFQHTHPEASRSLTGFQAHMKTSDSWPRSTVALLAGISTSTSISMGSLWLSERGHVRIHVCLFTLCEHQQSSQRHQRALQTSWSIIPFYLLSS